MPTTNEYNLYVIVFSLQLCLKIHYFQAAKPKLWNANGKKIQVQTKNTQRASYLHDLYTTLSMKHIPAQERVNALTSLKEFLKVKFPS